MEELQNPPAEFTPIPFWFFNDRPDKKRIREQLTDYVDKGVNGLVLHPRIGIPEDIPYLSGAYFQAVRYVVETAAELCDFFAGETARLDRDGVTRAAVETVAENTSDGVVAPLVFLALGGAPLGFFYKAVNTMDSMLGYVEPPYKNIGLAPARMDDVMNFLPARFSALLMLAAGALLGMDAKQGWKIFRRDRFNHASPNSAQTESVCAGLLGLRLAGDAWYHGVLHKKPYIGDALRDIEHRDIPRACRLLYGTAFFALAVCGGVKLLVLLAL